MSTTRKAKIRISKYIGFEASSSAISEPNVDVYEGGYDRALVAEMHRVGTGGGMIEVDANGLRDLAEWLDAMENSAGQGGNPSGARACRRLAEKALDLARELEPR